MYSGNIRRCSSYKVLYVSHGGKMVFKLFIAAPIVISMVNIVLLILMLYIYLSGYNKAQNDFVTILVLFAVFFLIQNLVFVVYFIFNIPNSLNAVIAPVIFSGFEFIALALLLKITYNEYIFFSYDDPKII